VCFYGIVCLISQCIYLLEFLNSVHDLKNEKLKPTDVSNKASPTRNLGTNLKELHTPKSTTKKLEGDNGDRKKKLQFDRVFYECSTPILGTFSYHNLCFHKLLASSFD